MLCVQVIGRESVISMSTTGKLSSNREMQTIILQRRFSNVILSYDDIAPTLEAGAGGGGNNLPMIIQGIKHEQQ